MNLRIPGPTPCPTEVLDSVSGQMINHRGPEFKTIIARLTKNLKLAFETTNDVLILTASGTGGLEAAIVNTLSPGDKVLAVVAGVFGERFAEVARVYGANVQAVTSPFGQPVNPTAVRMALEKDPSIKAVLVTHNETSTGVTNDLKTISHLAKVEFDKLLLVDAVSSLGSLPLPVDKWKCDVVVTGSQKGWMTPPGLSMISVSPRAWQAYDQAKMPRFYFDFKKAQSSLEKGQTPWTPAISILYGLDTALQMILREGLSTMHQRHAWLGNVCRQGVRGLGLELFADEMHASNTVTAVKVPEYIDGAQLVSLLRTCHNVVVAGGQKTMSGKIFRIGHLGYVTEQDIQLVMYALKETLQTLGFTPIGGNGGNI